MDQSDLARQSRLVETTANLWAAKVLELPPEHREAGLQRVDAILMETFGPDWDPAEAAEVARVLGELIRGLVAVGSAGGDLTGGRA